MQLYKHTRYLNSVGVKAVLREGFLVHISMARVASQLSRLFANLDTHPYGRKQCRLSFDKILVLQQPSSTS